MNLTDIQVVSANLTDSITLSFNSPRSSNPYRVVSVLGLDADEIITRYYGSGENVGDRFYDFSLQKRTIVIKVSLFPNFSNNQSYSDLRDGLYKLISSARTGAISLIFRKGLQQVATVSGFITKLETDHFSKNPDITITITTDDPMLRGLEPVVVDVSEFNTAGEVIEDEVSTAPHGVTMSFTFTGETDIFVLTDEDVSWIFGVSLTSPDSFEIGDVLYLSSEFGKKNVYLVRGESAYPIADAIVQGSVWPVIFPGENSIVCSDEIVWSSLSYLPTYWGV